VQSLMLKPNWIEIRFRKGLLCGDFDQIEASIWRFYFTNTTFR